MRYDRIGVDARASAADSIPWLRTLNQKARCLAPILIGLVGISAKGNSTGLGLFMASRFARQSGDQARLCFRIGQGMMADRYLPHHAGRAEGIDIPARTPRPAHARVNPAVHDEGTGQPCL